jgi:hypothetical protein
MAGPGQRLWTDCSAGGRPTGSRTFEPPSGMILSPSSASDASSISVVVVRESMSDDRSVGLKESELVVRVPRT